MNYYDEIRNELANNEVYKRVKDYSKNRSDLETYYNVGKLLVEAQGGESRAKYGDGLIKEYSKRLTDELGKKYSYRNLMHMRKYYTLFKDEKVYAMRSKLSWTHYRELLSLDDKNEINYYIKISEKYNLSYRELHIKIKNDEYGRLNDEIKGNFIVEDIFSNEIQDFIKHPILIRNSYNYEVISEKMLKQLILEDIFNFLKELGDGFSLVDSEYKIKIGDRYNYLDLLLFNYRYNCFVVVELKVTELKAEYVGQVIKYMNYIDKNFRMNNQEKTIGIIICKKDNKFMMEYCSDPRIYRTTYELINI